MTIILVTKHTFKKNGSKYDDEDRRDNITILKEYWLDQPKY